jgi:ecotin
VIDSWIVCGTVRLFHPPGKRQKGNRKALPALQYSTLKQFIHGEIMLMQRYSKMLVISSFLLSSVNVFAASDEMKPYPLAQDGYKRMVIHLQPLSDEDANKLEIIVGKTIKVDCNRHWFGGQITEEIAKGWGYPYYSLKSVMGPMSTRMACPSDKKEQETFVQVRSDQDLLRYNSKLPVVVYVPADFEVQYRIWTANEETGMAKVE